MPLDAARWSTRAANWALRTDVNESIRRWRNAIELLGDTPPSGEGLELGVQARYNLARWGARAGMPHDEIDRAIDEATELAQSAGNTAALAMIMHTHGAVNLYRGNVQQGRHSLLEAVRLADTTNDIGLKTATRTGPPIVYGVTGPIHEGLVMLDEALAWSAENPDRGREDVRYPLARNLCTRSLLLARAGRLRDARADADRAVTMARERGEPEILGWTLAVYPLIGFLAGDVRDPISQAEEAVRVAEDTGNVNMQPLTLCALGTAHINGGEWSSAVRACSLALDVARQHGLWLIEEGNMLMFLSAAYLGAGVHEAALEASDEAVVMSTRRETPIFECGALVTRSRVRRLSTDGDVQEPCAADLDRAVRVVEETGAEAWRPFVHVEHAELARLRGDVSRADQARRDALRSFDDNGAAGHASNLRTAWHMAR